jgi:nucleoside-diphosphate-sugar epimerase
VVVTGSLTEPGSDARDVVPSSPYAAAKWASSAYARMFHALYGTPVVILRPFMAYGPRQNPAKLIPHVISSLLRGTAPKLASGRWMADWIYVDDVIEGFALAARRPGIDGATIDLGSGVLTSTRDVVEKLVARIASPVAPQFGAVPDRPDEQVRRADVDAAKAVLGWQPRTPLDEGLDRTIAWYRSQL